MLFFVSWTTAEEHLGPEWVCVACRTKGHTITSSQDDN